MSASAALILHYVYEKTAEFERKDGAQRRMQTQRIVTTFEEELARNGRIVYTNVGVSMLPLLRQGRDIMVIERSEPSALRRYDAVLFRRLGVQGRGAYVLHRILRILSDGSFWIVGDNCIEGEIVSPDQILGVLTAVRRGTRTIACDSLRYRLYVRLWCAPYHLRFAILRFSRFCSRAFGWLKRRLRRRDHA